MVFLYNLMAFSFFSTSGISSVPVKVVVGSHVWVEDPEIAWIDGEVVEVNGEEIKIICTSGKTSKQEGKGKGLWLLRNLVLLNGRKTPKGCKGVVLKVKFEGR
ncbi:hypothetical protein AAG906_017877 [Vitis piasezkii]